MKSAAIVIGVISLLLAGYLAYTTLVINPRVVDDIQVNPEGERAARAMLLTFADGRTIPVNYLREGDTVFAGADGPWWRELQDNGDVTLEIRGQKFAGHAVVVLDDPEYTRQVFSRLRPSAPNWLPDWLNGKLIVVTLQGNAAGSVGKSNQREIALNTAADPVASTSLGQLRGERLANKAVNVFRGVHYGQTTAGEHRFKPPRPVEGWAGVVDASAFGDVCPQGGEVGRLTKVSGQLLDFSEDCLVLNIWTPAVDAGTRPVMVWFHGRGFYAGAGSEYLYDGANLAARGDVVVVTVNHRLNVFGHLYLGGLGGEAFAASGNAGVQDMELALRWVRDNISAFGGDGSNVTIFGESGGGAKVSTLLGVPSAKGLFRRGIIQSGPMLQATPLETAKQNTQIVMEKLKVSSVDALQAVPAADLLAAVTSDVRTTPNFGPVKDGGYLPSDMFLADSAPSAMGVPIIIGSNRDEYALYEAANPSYGRMHEDELPAALGSMLGERYDAVLAAYRQSRPDADPWDLMIAIRSSRFHRGTSRLADVHSKNAPVYVYSFDFPASEKLGAAHGQEIAFVFNNARSDSRPGADAVKTSMSEAWIAFARTGDPNHAALPRWPTYNTETRATMIFDSESHVENDPRSPERTVWLKE